MTDQIRYRGRFAPSPTGQLHFGSLIAAVASYLEARTNNGTWLIRMEDIDPPREVAGAADDILRTLEAFGFEWDEEVLYQSQRIAAYQAVLEHLISEEYCFSCNCSRKDILTQTQQRGLPMIYPGTCRHKAVKLNKSNNIRFRVSEQIIKFDDQIQGRHVSDMANDVGDFVIRRADGLFAYQIAVVVDDEYQGISDVVRGADLLDSTSRQITLQQALDYPTPGYTHIPVATDSSGKKLSKQARACPVVADDPVPALIGALNFLGQQVPPELAGADVRLCWQWGMENWQKHRIPGQARIGVTEEIPC